MKIIEYFCDRIEEEIEDAKGYAEHALRYKDDYPQQARTLDQLSKEELDHMAKLHKEVGALIEDYRREHGDPPPAMQARYDYLHERFIKWASEVRVLQAMFRDT